MAQENDIVLINFEDKPVVFARIEDISADIKKDWYHVKFLILQVPLHTVTWILKDVYIDGETFTMNGKQMRLERVVCPDEEEKPDESEKAPPQNSSKNGKVISLLDRKK